MEIALEIAPRPSLRSEQWKSAGNEADNMELDTVLEFAVTLAWDDLVTGDRLVSARVEYESRRGMPVDSLTVWTTRSWGYQDRVCDYRTTASQTHPAGLQFMRSYHSDRLAGALDYIMKNQAKFGRHDDAGRSHLVLVQPPAAGDARQAAAWMTDVTTGNRAHGAGPNAKE